MSKIDTQRYMEGEDKSSGLGLTKDSMKDHKLLQLWEWSRNPCVRAAGVGGWTCKGSRSPKCSSHHQCVTHQYVTHDRDTVN